MAELISNSIEYLYFLFLFISDDTCYVTKSEYVIKRNSFFKVIKKVFVLY